MSNDSPLTLCECKDFSVEESKKGGIVIVTLEFSPISYLKTKAKQNKMNSIRLFLLSTEIIDSPL